MNEILYSPEALNDLDGIRTYIQIDLQNPAAAQKTVFKILDTIGLLRDFTEIGPRLSTATAVGNDYRYLLCGKYMAFYRISENNVYIDRILYGRRDYLRILFDTEDDIKYRFSCRRIRPGGSMYSC